MLQERDGQDMPTLFNSAKQVLEELQAMKDDPESAEEAIDIDSQTISELEQLSQITKTELACKHPPDTSLLLSHVILTPLKRRGAGDQGHTDHDFHSVC